MPASTELWQKEQAAAVQRVTDEDRSAREALMATESFSAREPEAIRDLLTLTFRSQFHDRAQADRLQLFVPEDYAVRSERFGALGPELAGYDLHGRLRDVRVPTLIVYGSDEPGLAFGGSALREALPDSRLVTIDDSGHFPMLEEPSKFHRLMNDFLDLESGQSPQQLQLKDEWKRRVR